MREFHLKSACQLLSLWLGTCSPAMLLAAPGDTLFYDHLNGNLNSWTVASSGGDASIGNETANQGRSMRLRWGTVSATSDPFNALVPGAELSVWIRRGDDSFSEDPDTGDDLFVEYLNSSGSWVTLEQLDGDGTPGQIYQPTYALPTDALHAALQIRFRTTGNDGSDFDYWHVDDPRVTELAGSGGSSLLLGSCDDFEGGLDNWVVSSSGGNAGTSAATFNSPSNSLFTNGGVVSLTSNLIDLTPGNIVQLTAWVRRGQDSFSEDPDNNEDFVIEWTVSGSGWTLLQNFVGNGTPGEVFATSYTLPAAALQADFQIRVRQTGGSGNGDFWHLDDVCLTNLAPVSYSFEETSWTGAPGEVLDGSPAGLNGTVFGAASNDDTTPAIAGNPGTCRYADFDGSNDYIEVADAPEFDLSSELTVAAWINMRTLPSELHTIVSKDTNYEYHIDTSGRVYWWWVDSGGGARALTTAAPISLNQWHHVTITYQSGNQVIYVDGAARASSSFNGNLANNNLPFFIGTDWNFIARAFDGLIDEVYVYPQALSAADVQNLMLQTHPCATAGAQFTINHDNFGIHCVAETVTVDVVDALAGTPLLNYNATVELNTQSGNGTWQLIGGSGGFSDPTPDDGVATYDWPLGESQAVFQLSYLQGIPSIDIDVSQQSDPGVRDTDAEGDLVWSASGFTLTEASLSNPPPAVIDLFDATQIAAVPFTIHLTAYGQTANDPSCGVIESYTGARNLKFWSQYVDPGSGTVAVEIEATAIPASEASAVDQPVVFINGQASVTARYKDVGLKQVLVKDDTTVNADLPGGIRGATGNFVSIPADFALSDIRDAAGTIINPQALSATDPIFIAAGAEFRATVEALDADGDPTPNYGRESSAETVRLEVEIFEPVGGVAPAVTALVGFGPFSGGSATGLDFIWPEVGIMRMRPGVGDGDYLGAGDVLGNLSERVGRFVPSQFGIVLNNPLFATICSAGGFSYFGEQFNYLTDPVLLATAQAVGGSTTLNYTGAFFKFATGAVPARVYSAGQPLDLSAVPGPATDPVVVELGPGIARFTFSGGAGMNFTKGTPIGPYIADIRLAIDVIDADLVAAPMNPQVFGAASGIPFNAGDEIRYGRMRFVNAVGSERVNLAVPLKAEYFAGPGIGFVTNSADSCSSGVSLAFSAFTENLNPGETCVLDSGSPGASGLGCAAPAPVPLRFSEPPLGGDFNLTLAAPGLGNTGSVTLSATVPTWLRFDWNALVPGDENPTGQATFGIFSGEARQIYLREIY